MTLKVFKVKNKKFTNIHRNFYLKHGYLIIRGMFEKREMNTLDKSISFFADGEWHNIMNPDRIEFLISQSYEKFVKIKDQIEGSLSLNKQRKLRFYLDHIYDKEINLLMKKVVGKQMSGLMTHVIFKNISLQNFQRCRGPSPR